VGLNTLENIIELSLLLLGLVYIREEDERKTN